jgi:ABC-type amino acid transport substrate-binding protein
MFAAIRIIANVTAGIAAAFTVQNLHSSITGLSDLPGKRVATVAATTSSTFLANRGIDLAQVATIDKAYSVLERHQVDAVVFDAPVLQCYARTAGAGHVRVVGPIFDAQDYGIALPAAPTSKPSMWPSCRPRRTAPMNASKSPGSAHRAEPQRAGPARAVLRPET